MLMFFACSSSPTVEKKEKPHEKKHVATKEVATVRALVGEMKVEVPEGTHRVVSPSIVSDYNMYPANNGVLLQGVATGPIGNHKNASIWLTGVHDPDVENGPSHLEAVLVYPVDCDDCPGEDEVAVKIESSKSTEGKPARLLRVEWMKVEDLDKDGSFEVVLSARYRPCCEGDPKQFMYTEYIVLKVDGEKIERWPAGEKIVRAR